MYPSSSNQISTIILKISKGQQTTWFSMLKEDTTRSKKLTIIFIRTPLLFLTSLRSVRNLTNLCTKDLTKIFRMPNRCWAYRVLSKLIAHRCRNCTSNQDFYHKKEIFKKGHNQQKYGTPSVVMLMVKVKYLFSMQKFTCVPFKTSILIGSLTLSDKMMRREQILKILVDYLKTTNFF